MKDHLPPQDGRCSRLPRFYRLPLGDRHGLLRERFGLDEDDIVALTRNDHGQIRVADKMVENCVGLFPLPIGLGLNFRVNEKDYVVPMAIEEPSVVAAVSNTARLVYQSGGFQADADEGLMVGQIQLLEVADLAVASKTVFAHRDAILSLADTIKPGMRRRGGGACEVEVRIIDADRPMLVVHILVDCLDAMGANTVNDIAEGIAPMLEELTGGRAHLRILSNLSDRRLARARCSIPHRLLSVQDAPGSVVADGIERACEFAALDPYRAATHNKGIMNGVDAVAIATGNDWRGIEAGAHAYAARSGHYTSLTRWWNDGEALQGSIELPMAVATVGGSTDTHPTLRAVRKLLGVTSAQELAMLMAAVGLAQNLGALRALSTEGIQRGHMNLHARKLADEGTR